MWIEIKLEEITTVVTKGTTPTTLGFQFQKKGINFIKAEALNGSTSLLLNGIYHISDDAYVALSRSILKENDILLTIAGANIGKCGFVTRKILPANTNQAVAIVRIDEKLAIPKFVYFYFKQQATFQYIQGINAQAAQPNLNLTTLKNFKINLCNLATQKRIADILSAYDDAIENNNRRIALLEKTARHLYEEWFVRMRFPNYENTKIVDGLPVGWEKCILSDVVQDVFRGITPQYDEQGNSTVINQKCIRDGKLSLLLSRRQKKVIPHKKILQYGDVLINSTGEGTLGRVAPSWLQSDELLTVDSHVTIVRSNDLEGICWLGSCCIALQAWIAKQGKGTTNQTELSRDTILNIKIVNPTASVKIQYTNLIKPLTVQIVILQQQNQKLIQARDLLLPRLMSGKIAV